MTSTAAGGRVFTERELVQITLDLLIESHRPFTSNDVRRILRDTFRVREIHDPNEISMAFRSASQAGEIQRTGRIDFASQPQANARSVTEWVSTEVPFYEY